MLIYAYITYCRRFAADYCIIIIIAFAFILCIAVALPLRCRCIAVVLPLYCRCIAVALPLRCRCIAVALFAVLFIAVILHTLCFALAAGQGMRLHKPHLGGDAQHCEDALLDFALHLFDMANLVGEKLLAHFHLYLKGVGVVFTVYYQQVMGSKLAHFYKDGFHLSGEYIYAAHHYHIVGAPHYALHTAVCSAAGAGGGVKGGKVAGSVAQQGHALLGDGGEHKLAGLAVGQGSAGFGVDDLGEEAVLRYMEAVMLGAFHGYAGAGDLAEAVDVEAFDAQALFDIAAHGVRPGLCAEDAEQDAQQHAAGREHQTVERGGIDLLLIFLAQCA